MQGRTLAQLEETGSEYPHSNAGSNRILRVGTTDLLLVSWRPMNDLSIGKQRHHTGVAARPRDAAVLNALRAKMPRIRII